ncbi:MAG: LLM class flavin-dependent oxidoreductase [Candidatus Binataceae bacterium]|nr:LLM class flavin-dependent oxidoreductase [Candidatus Binataceae bacterium]
MKVGLIYEIESVKPHSPDHEYRVFWDTMAQIERADQLGFDSVWAVEHHFLNEFSYCSAPEVFLGCVSQRTSRIRIGHGVAVLPFNHPIRVAERIAVLDIMSNGRVEFGTGRSTTMDEILGFGLKPEETRPRWREAIEMIPRMWRDDPFSYEGQFWSVTRPVSVIPKPIQKPHPPMWVAAVSPDTFKLAAQAGLGALGFTLGVEPSEVASRVRLYRDTPRDPHAPGAATNRQVSLNLMCMAGRDSGATDRAARDAVLWYARRGLELVQEVGRQAPRDEQSYHYLHQASRVDPADITRDYYEYMKEADLIAVGDAAEIVRVAARYHEIGADQILFLVQYGGLSHAQVMETIEVLGVSVIPELRSWPTPGAVTPS